jgi:hypothetical protein
MVCNASSAPKHRSWARRKWISTLLMFFSFNTLTATGQNFFPSGVFSPGDPKLDSFVAKWYADQLSALNEPSLFEAKQDSTIQSYRFLWLRTFHHPVAIRVLLHPDGTGTVFTKVADGAGGFKPGNLILNKTVSLTAERVKNVVGRIQRLKYWMLPRRDANADGMDGAQWVIEGIDHGKYRLVDRWSPESGPIRELGLYFLRELSGLDLKTEEIY